MQIYANFHFYHLLFCVFLQKTSLHERLIFHYAEYVL